MNVRSVWEMMTGSKQSAEVPAERAEMLTALLEAPVQTGETGAATAEPEILTETGEAEAVTAEPEARKDSDGGASAPAPQRAFTARNRKSIQTEEWLEKELARRNTLKRYVEDTLATLADDKKRFLGLVISGEGWADKALSDTLGKIEAEERKLKVFTEEVSKAQADLDNFRAWIEAYAGERARIQAGLADLAAARLGVDWELQRLLRQALAMLKVREETVEFMRRQAAAIDLTGDFSAGVPASLHEALSLEIVSGSKAWNARFLGEEKRLTPYVVSAESFEPEIETLTRKAVYRFGETVYLLEEEAAEFLRNDRPLPNGRGWETLPPTLMTAEAFAAAQAEAGPIHSKLMIYVLRQSHEKSQQKRREAYLLERRGTLTRGQHHEE